MSKIAFWFCFVFILWTQQNAFAFKLDLSTICRQTTCSLTNIISTLDDPLVWTNATAPILLQLIMRNSQLKRVPSEVFIQAPHLQAFFMHNCGINALNAKDFNNAKQLQILTLQRNRLYDLPEEVFKAVETLEKLQLSHNNIRLLHAKAFSGLRNLKYLDLQQNSIDVLPINVFAELVALTHIDLSGNEITKIDAQTFATNSQLQILMLANNKFSVFEPNSLQHLMQLRFLDVNQCEIYELRLQSVNTLLAQNAGLGKLSIEGAVIKIHAGNNQLNRLRITDKLSVRELELHGNQLISLDAMIGMDNLQRLDVSRNQINALPISAPLTLYNLNYLNLASNQLQNLSAEYFLLLQKLTHLDIAFNHMQQLNESIFEPLINLEKLYIEGNRLSRFDFEQFIQKHNALHEFGIFENDWDLNYMNNMISFLKKRNIQLPERFKPSSIVENHGTSSYNPLKHYRYGSTSAYQDEATETSVSSLTTATNDICGIHPYWTRQDYFALAILSIVFVILLLQFYNILSDEGCIDACLRCCRNSNITNLQRRQRLDEEDSEV